MIVSLSLYKEKLYMYIYFYLFDYIKNNLLYNFYNQINI